MGPLRLLGIAKRLQTGICGAVYPRIPLISLSRFAHTLLFPCVRFSNGCAGAMGARTKTIITRVLNRAGEGPGNGLANPTREKMGVLSAELRLTTGHTGKKGDRVYQGSRGSAGASPSRVARPSTGAKRGPSLNSEFQFRPELP